MVGMRSRIQTWLIRYSESRVAFMIVATTVFAITEILVFGVPLKHSGALSIASAVLVIGLSICGGILFAIIMWRGQLILHRRLKKRR